MSSLRAIQFKFMEKYPVTMNTVAVTISNESVIYQHGPDVKTLAKSFTMFKVSKWVL